MIPAEAVASYSATDSHDRDPEAPEDSTEHVDVLIIGAGLSGIGAACHLPKAFPARSYAILEAREDLGGTWDLFRYPGVRSDSDMHTLGYRFKPWTGAKAIADGSSILDYLRQAAQTGWNESRFRHRAVRAEWSTDQARWTVQAQLTDTAEAVEQPSGGVSVCCN